MLKTQEITINFGPQHPSSHGVFRAVLTLDGERVTKEVNHLGYLHRGMDKIAESRSYTQFIPYTDRLDYTGGMLNNLGYVQTIEKLMGIEVPERAEYIRIIFAELQRIAAHQIYIGSIAVDCSGTTPFLYCLRDRENVLDLFEMTCGSRLTPSYMRIGGVAADLPPEFMPALQSLVKILPAGFEEYDGMITGNEIFQARTKGVGVTTKEMALDYGFTGPNARASGVDYDLRRDEPYGIYDRFEFNVPVLEGGDVFSRFQLRTYEVRESLRIIKQAMKDIPDGPVMAKVPKVLKPQAGEAFHRIEASKGHLAFYVVSDGSTKPYRLHVHSPAFVNVGIMPEIAVGNLIQDFVVNLASIDPVLGEIDR